MSSCPNKKDDHLSSCSFAVDPDTLIPTCLADSVEGMDLSTERIGSSIPKTHSESTWQYPSAQMFYRALSKKGFTTDASDIDSMLVVHNHLNEGVWKEILKWESLYSSSCSPSLKRFLGRPTCLSPKARLSMLLGSPRPFDRHDWFVDRCGKEVRYVIDYYEGNTEPDGSPTMHVDVRPALDSFQALFRRARMLFNSN